MKHNEIYKLLDLVINYNSKIFIWLSWWSDSIYLLNIIEKYFIKNNLESKNIYILHYNHWYRSESIDEYNYIKKKYYDYNIKYSKYKWSDFSENNLRKNRYKFFYDTINKLWFNNNILFLWHNLTDRIETTFLNLIRWCDIEWFINMKNIEIINDKLILCRPLLNITKSEIKDNCNLNNLKYFEDETNKDINFSQRNCIREKVLNNILDMWSNKFFDSFLQIYKYLEKNVKINNIEFISIKKSKYWDVLNSYYINKKNFEISDIVYIFKKLNIYNNIYKNTLLEFNNFFNKKWSWIKYFNGYTFIMANSNLYAFQWNMDFFRKDVKEKVFIKEKWIYEIWDFKINIYNDNCIWWNILLWWTELKFNWKSVMYYLKNKKVPIFRRKYIPIIVKNWKVIDILVETYKNV